MTFNVRDAMYVRMGVFLAAAGAWLLFFCRRQKNSTVPWPFQITRRP